MPDPKDLRDLVGEDVSPEELDRLRRVHELLVAAGPPPELSPTLASAPAITGTRPSEGRFSILPQRRLGTAIVVAAGLAAIGFGAGYLTGHTGRGFDAKHTVVMRGAAAGSRAVGEIEIGHADKGGNTPMLIHVRGLPKLGPRGYYELYLTREKRPVLTCGTFKVKGGTATTTFRLSVPYSLGSKRWDGWVVTHETVRGKKPGPVVLTT